MSELEALAERLKRRMAWEGKKIESLLAAYLEALRREQRASMRELRGDLKRIEETLEMVARELGRKASSE